MHNSNFKNNFMADNEEKKGESKQKIAVALKYEAGSDIAPKVTASGKNLIADLILELAKEKNIPLYQDKELADLLIKIDIDTNIPLEAYSTVAEILAFIYKRNKEIIFKKTMD
jgi:flagellar biosynthesis protein